MEIPVMNGNSPLERPLTGWKFQSWEFPIRASPHFRSNLYKYIIRWLWNLLCEQASVFVFYGIDYIHTGCHNQVWTPTFLLPMQNVDSKCCMYTQTGIPFLHFVLSGAKMEPLFCSWKLVIEIENMGCGLHFQLMNQFIDK